MYHYFVHTSLGNASLLVVLVFLDHFLGLSDELLVYSHHLKVALFVWDTVILSAVSVAEATWREWKQGPDGDDSKRFADVSLLWPLFSRTKVAFDWATADARLDNVLCAVVLYLSHPTVWLVTKVALAIDQPVKEALWSVSQRDLWRPARIAELRAREKAVLEAKKAAAKKILAEREAKARKERSQDKVGQSGGSATPEQAG